MKEFNYSKLVTAHHLNDSIETSIFNLAKGSGIAGLSGIPNSSEQVVRPLSPFNKDDILNYAEANRIKWREDLSNLENKYSRNLIRNHVVPLLKLINPNLELSMQSGMERISGARKIVNHFIEDLQKKAISYENDYVSIGKKHILASPDPGFILYELIKNYGFNYDQSKQIFDSINETGKLFKTRQCILNVDRDKLIISSQEFESFVFEIEKGQLKFSNANISLSFSELKTPVEIDQSEEIANLDLDKLVFPLVIRNWKAGDLFYPLGLGHKRKISDFLVDQKVPLLLKKHVLVLTSGNKIVWVVGHRVDDRFKITDSTRKSLEVRLVSNV